MYADRFYVYGIEQMNIFVSSSFAISVSHFNTAKRHYKDLAKYSPATHTKGLCCHFSTKDSFFFVELQVLLYVSTYTQSERIIIKS